MKHNEATRADSDPKDGVIAPLRLERDRLKLERDAMLDVCLTLLKADQRLLGTIAGNYKILNDAMDKARAAVRNMKLP